jgi:SNF2 family DNA or RNA helicase
MFQLGSFEVDAYSTTRASASPAPGDDGSGPLLLTGAPLELRWAPEAKRPRARPGSTASSAGREGGTIRFDSGGVEIGRFPNGATRTLMPLLLRRLIDVEATVGSYPPRTISLGTTVRVQVRVTLRSTALTFPGQVVAGAGRPKSTADSKASGKPNTRQKTQNSVQTDEADREVQRVAIAQLLERLNLQCRRSSQLPAGTGEPAGGLGGLKEAGPTGATSSGANAEEQEGGDEDDEPAEQEMSREAAAQLGGYDALERLDIPAVSMPDAIFKAKLRHYQAQAVYWMWHRENPTSQMPRWLVEGGEAQSKRLAQIQPENHLQQRNPEHRDQVCDNSSRDLHPMWDEYELPVSVRPLPGREAARFLYHHRTTGALSLDFPDAALAQCRGGILADDMGLGKTIMSLGLLALDFASDVPSARTAAPELRALDDDGPTTQKHLEGYFKPGVDDGVGGMLVIAPVSLIRQWHAEIERFFPAATCPTVHEYHGAGRHCTTEQLRSFGVVLTTYGTMSSEREDAPLFQIYWRRVVLDEGHSIKNRCSRQAQAAFRLRTFCRWCVTGTPLQNSVEELFSLVRFLRVDPWSAWQAWRKAVSLPFERGRHGDDASMREALDTVRRIVQPLLIRRTKATVDPKTGRPLLELPTKHVHVLELSLSQAERDFYDELYKRAKSKFDSFLASGAVTTNFTHILQLIMKLRQALCHPFLVFAREYAQDSDMASFEQRCVRDMMGSDGLSEKFVEGLLDNLRTGELPDCPICCDAPEDPTVTPCGHVYCRECAIKIVRQCKGECPVCRRTGIDRKSLRVLPGASRFPAHLLAGAGAQGGTASSDSDGSRQPSALQSTKVKELVKLLREDMAAGRRAVVFSQWTSFLDLVEKGLGDAAIPWRRFDGSLSLEERQKRVAWLGEPAPNSEAAGRALLVSLKAGGVGLNLVAATRLYLLDLWWNPAVEEQAIQRVHRIGQTSEVHVYKFVVRDTIDNDLLDLHRAKEHLLEDAVRGGHRSEAATKLTLDDLKRLFNPCRTSLKALRSGATSESAAPAEASLMSMDRASTVDAPLAAVPPPPAGDVAMATAEAAQGDVAMATAEAAQASVDVPTSCRENNTGASDSDSDFMEALAQYRSSEPTQVGESADCVTDGPHWEAGGNLHDGDDYAAGHLGALSDHDLLASYHTGEAMPMDEP